MSADGEDTWILPIGWHSSLSCIPGLDFPRLQHRLRAGALNQTCRLIVIIFPTMSDWA